MKMFPAFAHIPSASQLVLAVALAFPVVSFASVTRLIIESRQSPVFNGRAFGTAGAYEYVTGRVVGELDPADRHNTIITDLSLAPRNDRGKVEYEATFSLLKPVDMSKTSGVLLYNVPNRGNHTMEYVFNVGGNPIAGDPGDGFLFQRGDVILFSGWQGDLPPKAGLETVKVPVARNADGSRITGPVLVRFRDFKETTATLPIPGARTPASLDTSMATLTKRASEDGAVIPIGADQWAFSDCRSEPFPGKADPARISLKAGFDPAYLYELTYVAKDPLVLGIGLAATRDIVSFFRRESQDGAGSTNPLGGRISHVVAHGMSQSGNFVKSFIHLGFNEDESGRIVWDGANAHIAGRQTPLNFRFAIPGGAVSLYEPGSEGVLWWSRYPDPARKRPTAGLLDRARASNTVPKIFETFGSAEFWSLRMSPGLVGTDAAHDIPLPTEVRRYYFPGTAHGGGAGGFNEIPVSALNHYGLATSANPRVAANPNPQVESMRALVLALINWVVKGAEPPASSYPRLDRGELVYPDTTAMGFPRIPGVALPDHMLNPFYDYDFGPDFNYNDLSGVMKIQPPHIRQVLPSLVPKVDADGNEISGIPSVLHQAPLGSYLGWNIATEGFYRDRIAGFTASFIPFAKTKADRLAAGDPRPSLEERYGTHEGYVATVRAAATRSVHAGFLLQEDADRLVAAAAAGNVLSH